MPLIDETIAFLRALDHARSGPLVELRYRRGAGMAQSFVDACEIAQVGRIACALGARTDTYFGVLPRLCARGSRDAVGQAHVAWVDCDTAEAAARLTAFAPAPSLVVRSGSSHGRHAYWLLDRPVPPPAIEQLNRRLAAALDADPAAVDAARILRVPSTTNFKYEPPGVVRLQRCSDARVDLAELSAALPRLSMRRRASEPRHVDADPLRCIAPERYVAALVGSDIGRDHKVRCPFHEDRTPSLHVYEGSHRGWFCFGCRRGGSIYDLAAGLWDLETHGSDFLELRRRLRELFTS